MRHSLKFLFTGVVAAAFALIPSNTYSQQRTAAKPATRQITVVTEPGASVYINGVRYGTTDESGSIKLRHTPPGSLSLRIRAGGYRDETRVLTAAFSGKIEVKLSATEDPFDLAFQEAERLSALDRRLAAEAFERAIEIRPKDPNARLALARLLTEMREYQRAEEAVAEARKLRPSFAEASAVEGRIFREEGDFERAVAAFERGIREANGVHPEAAAGLGLLYADMAETAAAELDIEAEERYKKLAIKRLTQAKDQLYGAEDAIIIYQLLGRALEKQNLLNEAIAVYERFLEIFPDVPDATAVRSFIVQLNIQLKERR
ncbi:MAG TPA: tetratricopeptide repeat protein [Pyrinomonadaceae bacterium]|nr:tetratricopeptide repeat protein [Pyrinomonadaceae bacterium]